MIKLFTKIATNISMMVRLVPKNQIFPRFPRNTAAYYQWFSVGT